MTNMQSLSETLAGAEYAYLTTTGRVSGRWHTVEIWFAAADQVAYLISGAGDRADWVRNLRADPRARLRIGDAQFPVVARVALEDPAERRTAANLLHAKYGSQTSSSADDWARGGFLVALDLHR